MNQLVQVKEQTKRQGNHRWSVLVIATLFLTASLTTVSTAVDLTFGDMRTAEAASASDCTDEGSYRRACVTVTATRLDPDSWNASVQGWGAPSYVYLYVQMIVYDTSTYGVIYNVVPTKLKANFGGATIRINTFGDCNSMIQVDGWAWRAGFSSWTYTPQAHKSIKA